MIRNNEVLSMAEIPLVLKNAKVSEEESARIIPFINKFVKTKPEKAIELKNKLKELDVIKVKDEHIAKIIDTMPQDANDLNKIFVEVSLDEDETKKLLDVIKEYK
jgi:DNA-directed RNA polymerase subunit F